MDYGSTLSAFPRSNTRGSSRTRGSDDSLCGPAISKRLIPRWRRWNYVHQRLLAFSTGLWMVELPLRDRAGFARPIQMLRAIRSLDYASDTDLSRHLGLPGGAIHAGARAQPLRNYA